MSIYVIEVDCFWTYTYIVPPQFESDLSELNDFNNLSDVNELGMGMGELGGGESLMGSFGTTDLQKSCLLGYSLAQRFQLFMMFFFSFCLFYCAYNVVQSCLFCPMTLARKLVITLCGLDRQSSVGVAAYLDKFNKTLPDDYV